MEIFTVSFFGHRKINNPLIVEKKLDEYISDLSWTNIFPI